LSPQIEARRRRELPSAGGKKRFVTGECGGPKRERGFSKLVKKNSERDAGANKKKSHIPTKTSPPDKGGKK